MDPIFADTLVKASEAVQNAIKIAGAAQDMLALAPKPATPEEVTKTAALFVQHGWVNKEREPALIAALSDPGQAMRALQNVVIKAAEEIAKARDPRLANGRAIDSGTDNKPATPKQASDESPADLVYLEKVANYKNRRA